MLVAPGGEQVVWGTEGPVVAAQYLKQTRGEHSVAVLVPFALLDAEPRQSTPPETPDFAAGRADAASGIPRPRSSPAACPNRGRRVARRRRWPACASRRGAGQATSR